VRWRMSISVVMVVSLLIVAAYTLTVTEKVAVEDLPVAGL